MDNRRVLLAIVLTFAVLTAWSLLVAPRRPDVAEAPAPGAVLPAESGTPSPTPGVERSDTEAPPELASPAQTASAAVEVHVHSELYDVTLSNRGGTIQRWALQKYRASVPKPGEISGPVELVTDGSSAYLPIAILTGEIASEEKLSSALYAVEGGDARLGPGEQATVTFTWSDGQGTRIEKRLTFNGSSYVVGVSVKAQLAGQRNAYLSLGPRLLDHADPAFRSGYAGRVAMLVDGSVSRIAQGSISLKKLTAPGEWPPRGRGGWLAQGEAAGQVTRPGAATWAGMEDNYFAGILFGSRPLPQVWVSPAPEAPVNGVVRLAVGVPIDPGGTELSLFMGPKDTDVLKAIDPTLVRVIDFGRYFDSLARLLLVVLKFFYTHVHNYGVAIILLTLVVKILFLPLSIKQLHAMQKMTKLRPQMKEIEARYEGRGKGDPAERMEQNRKKNAEMMALYQREGINPASGCLPLLLQLPVLYGLLALLGASIELRHAPFVLWVQDLSAKDPLYVTPILMLISMMVMQAITPTAADPMQRRMMFIMPVLFAWIFKDLASGLGLYWLTQNVLSIVQQSVMNRWTQRRELREKEAKRLGKGKRIKG